MTTASWLRAGVWVLVVGALVDPRLTSARRPRLDVDVAVPRGVAPVDGASPATTDGAITALVTELIRATAGDARLRVRPYGDGDRLPCAAAVPCVVVTSDTVAPRGGLDRLVPLVTIAPPVVASPGTVAIDDVRVAAVAVDDAAVAQVTLSAAAVAGRTTTIEIRDGGVVTGRRRHTWTDRSPVTLDVPWWPAQAGARRLEVTATTAGADGTLSPSPRVVVTADVDATPWPLLVVEARPSWAATFVRRALEADRRVSVDAVAVLAPGLVTGRGAASLDDARVGQARVVVVGGLDAVTAGDVARFDRFLRIRGGTLVLIPDAAIAGPIASLVPGRWRRIIEPRASSPDAGPAAPAGGTLTALRASEWLVGSDLAAGDEVLATHDGAPVVVARRVGEGRVIVVGALDAWRFRLPAADDATAGTASASASPSVAAAYDTAWRALIAQLARETGATVDVRVSHAAGDDTATIDVQARSMAPSTAVSVAAQLVCGADAVPLRLWPQARAGHVRARAAWPAAGTTCDVVAAVAGVGEGRASLTAPPATRGEATRTAARLAAIATTSGGRVAGAGDTAAVAGALAALRSSTAVDVPVWPLRAWWWGAVAALGLGLEWWLRRRAGAR